VATLTVRNVPDEAKHRFRQVAAAHGRSMEEHLRQLIIAAPALTLPPASALEPTAESRARIERLLRLGQGIDWQPPAREPAQWREIEFG
jgi:plasmid stability protein